MIRAIWENRGVDAASYRAGDADRDRVAQRLRVALEEGLTELAGWLEGQAAVDRVAQASAELAARGLTV